MHVSEPGSGGGGSFLFLFLFVIFPLQTKKETGAIFIVTLSHTYIHTYSRERERERMQAIFKKLYRRSIYISSPRIPPLLSYSPVYKFLVEKLKQNFGNIQIPEIFGCNLVRARV